ncbi:MAG: molybdopterin-dependent oxidoreductase [Chloroflexi bacterium]|nr:molybdopterin-dependent oxidoreductase [Chloroflexota bacterium]
MQRFWPSVGFGALAGALLSAPLLGLMYLADKLLDLPFVPFALFDWIATVTPGPLITFGIDMMIESLLLFNLSVADAAKTSEQIAAVLMVFFIGVAAGAVLFAVLRGRGPGDAAFQGGWLGSIFSQPAPGLIVAAVVGLPLTIVSLPMGQSTMNPVVTFIVLVILFLVWGLGLGYLRQRLSSAQPIAIEGVEEEERSVSVIDRRQFLIRLGATTATITVASAGLGAALGQGEQARLAESVADSMPPDAMPPRRALPNDGDPVTPAPGTRPEFTPVEDHYQVFLRTEPTFIDISNWVLPIHGAVANPRELTIEQIRSDYPSRDQYVTLSCISGRIGTTLISTTWWTGAVLQSILADVQPLPNAKYLVIKSADGFYETVALDLIASDERIMLCYAWDGEALPFDHGFPLRIWLPDRYGMKQPKWIVDIEVTDEYEEGYWVERGWDEVARVKATSVIDTVAVRNVVEADGQRLVPVGGIAFAGARGISGVQVRVDGGPWQDAQLRSPLSETTWVIWRYDWPFAAGDHTFEVRCAEADGTPQIEEEQGNRPSGATGIHNRKASL